VTAACQLGQSHRLAGTRHTSHQYHRHGSHPIDTTKSGKQRAGASLRYRTDVR
jgi:hypothetical protein